MNATNHLKFI